MSHSPFERKATSQSQEIPTRRIVITDPNNFPTDVAATPGGTMYSTTPGGTRIVYERSFMMNLRQSPLSKTPPKHLPNIPGITSPGKNLSPPPHSPQPPKPEENGDVKEPVTKEPGDEPQFEMDM